MRTRPHVLAVALFVCLASVADAHAAGPPTAFQAGARIAANPAGGAVAAWAGATGVRAVAGDRAGGLGSAVQLSTAKNTFNSPQVAIDDRGDAIVVWETYRRSGGGECSTCPAHLVSDGVWASLRGSASGFGPAIALAGPQRDTGAEYQLAEPQLAMSPAGQAVIAWSDASGAMTAFRAPDGSIGAPRRVQPAGFAVRSAVIADDGRTVLADQTGRVTAGVSGAFAPPEPLPDSASPYGPGARLAGNAAGEVLAVYPGTRGLEVSRRPAGGAWSAPAVLVAGATGASERAATLSDGGVGTVVFAQIAGRTNLMTAVLRPREPPVIGQVDAAGLDAEMAYDGNGLAIDRAGDGAVVFHRSDGPLASGIAQLAYAAAGGGAFTTIGSLTPPGVHVAGGDGADVAFAADGELLATWTDHYPGEDRIMVRWIGPGPLLGPAITLDAGASRDIAVPVFTGHVAQLTIQGRRRADRRGRIPVGLRCVSLDRRPCAGTLKLTAGPRRWAAGRKRFRIAPASVLRVRVTLTARARRIVRQRGHVALRATTSGGTFAGPSSRIVVRR